MNKRFWLISGLLAMALLLLWTLTPPQKTGTGAKEKVWRGWPGLAAARPYALAQDFLRDRGIELVVDDHPRGDFPPADVDVLLLENSNKALSEKQQTRLHNWVEAGGLLLLESGHPLGEVFDVKWQTLTPEEDGYLWHGRDGALQITTPVKQYIESSGTGNAYPGKSGKTLALESAVGSGHVIAFAHDFGLWTNRADAVYIGKPAAAAPVPLAQGDNAAFLHELLQDKKHALLVRGSLPGEHPPWQWSWPGARWWPLIASGVLLLVALLYYWGRRFGTLRPPPAGNAGDIARHLQAAGSYWAADRDGYSFLGEQVRTRLLADIEARQCHYPDRAAQLADMASRSGMSEAEIEALLATRVPRSEDDFIDYMIAVAQIRRTL